MGISTGLYTSYEIIYNTVFAFDTKNVAACPDVMCKHVLMRQNFRAGWSKLGTGRRLRYCETNQPIVDQYGDVLDVTCSFDGGK
jgi:hypothetical protein